MSCHILVAVALRPLSLHKRLSRSPTLRLVIESDNLLRQRLRTNYQLAEHLRRVYNLKLGESFAHLYSSGTCGQSLREVELLPPKG